MTKFTESERAQLAAFERLSQKDAALVMGVDVRTLRRWEEEPPDGVCPLPRNADGTYHIQALSLWRQLMSVLGHNLGEVARYRAGPRHPKLRQ
jgi:hypothetical protein